MYADSRVCSLSSDDYRTIIALKGLAIFMVYRGRFERVHVGSCIRYVGSYSLCVGFFSYYGDYYMRHVGC